MPWFMYTNTQIHTSFGLNTCLPFVYSHVYWEICKKHTNFVADSIQRTQILTLTHARSNISNSSFFIICSSFVAATLRIIIKFYSLAFVVCVYKSYGTEWAQMVKAKNRVHIVRTATYKMHDWFTELWSTHAHTHSHTGGWWITIFMSVRFFFYLAFEKLCVFTLIHSHSLS